MKLAIYQVDTFRVAALTAEQGGKRRGQLRCALKGDRVIIYGKAVLFLKGTIYL